MNVYPARLRNQALYSFINPPLSHSLLRLPKVNPVNVMFLMVTACVRSSSGAPVFRTVGISHLWATQTSGHPPPQLLTRTPTTAPPRLPPASRRLQRYEVQTTGYIKDFQVMTRPLWKFWGNNVSSWLHF